MVTIALTAIFLLPGCKKNSADIQKYMKAVVNGSSWQSGTLFVELQDRGLGLEPSKITGLINNSEISLWIPSASPGSHSFRNNQINPVVLLYFRGEFFESSHLLTWATATETNLSNFNIELSTDGLNWTTIETVNATGSGSNYQKVVENNLSLGTRSYYRLKIYETNGSYQYSSIVVITENYPAYYKPSGGLARRGYNGNLEITSINRETRFITGRFYFKTKTVSGVINDISGGEFQTSY